MIANKTCTYPIKVTKLGDHGEQIRTLCGKPAVRRFIFPEHTAWACREHEEAFEELERLFGTWSVNFDGADNIP